MLNGDLVAGDDAKIPAVSSGLYYGAGAFETFLSERGKIFKLNEHIERLNKGLKYLGVSDMQAIDYDVIKRQITTLLQKIHCKNRGVRIRIQISLAEKGGYSHTEEPTLIVMITASKKKMELGSARLMLSDIRLIPSSVKPNYFKLSNMLHYRQAYRQAEKKGMDDALMLTMDEYIGETAIANIFWKHNDQIFTPSEDCDILPGIMRASVIDILENRMNFLVQKDKFSLKNILQADLIWITNSVKGVLPVSRLGENCFDIESEFYATLGKELISYKNEFFTYV